MTRVGRVGGDARGAGEPEPACGRAARPVAPARAPRRGAPRARTAGGRAPRRGGGRRAGRRRARTTSTGRRTDSGHGGVVQPDLEESHPVVGHVVGHVELGDPQLEVAHVGGRERHHLTVAERLGPEHDLIGSPPLTRSSTVLIAALTAEALPQRDLVGAHRLGRAAPGCSRPRRHGSRPPTRCADRRRRRWPGDRPG